MNQEQLESLKNQILSDVTPLVLADTDNTSRFDLLLRIIKSGGGTGDIYNRAYESAKQIQDRDEQLDSLLALLDEVEFDMTSVPTSVANVQSEDSPLQPVNGGQEQNPEQPL